MYKRMKPQRSSIEITKNYRNLQTNTVKIMNKEELKNDLDVEIELRKMIETDMAQETDILVVAELCLFWAECQYNIDCLLTLIYIHEN